MKKVLCLLLIAVFAVSLCACNSSSDNDTNNGANISNSEIQNQDEININTKEAYVGEWKKERTDAEPFAMTLTLNADGTGLSGTKTAVEWSYDEAANQISLVMHYSDGSAGEPTIAKLNEDGKLCWNYTFNVKAADGSIFEVQQVIFDRSK